MGTENRRGTLLACAPPASGQQSGREGTSGVTANCLQALSSNT